MERDFLGLSVKQETSQETNYPPAPVRNSQLQMQWPFSKKDSSSRSFHGAQEEQPKSGFKLLARSVALENEYLDSSQKNIGSENPVGVRYSMSTDTYPFHHSVFNQTNLTMSPSATNSMHNSIITRRNLIGSASSQRLAAAPVMPSKSPDIGTTELRNASINPMAPAQLTIFYNGSVCVYDNVAPEKAQAIMLLAGNGLSLTFPATTPPLAPPVQAPIPKPNTLDGFVVSQSYNPTLQHSSPAPVLNSISVSQSYNHSPTPPRSSPAPVMNSISVSHSYNNSPSPHCSSATPIMNSISISQSYNNCSTPRLSSPAPVMNSISVSQSYNNSPTPHRSSPARVISISGSPSGVTQDTSFAKSSQPHRVGSSQGAAALSADAVPQFRRRSLARFMERRKERAILANPYADFSKPENGGKS